MEVKITGTKNPKEVDFLKKAYIYYAETLLSPSDLKDCQVEVALRVRGFGISEKGKLLHDVKQDISVKQKHFRIMLLKGLGIIELLKILAHEMVHLKQALRGELSFVGTTGYNFVPYWKGVSVVEISYLAHANYPWEKEAYSREVDLYESFMLTQVKPVTKGA